MESVIFQDSPLAEFLEGEGFGENEWATTTISFQPPSPKAISFAPRGIPKPPPKSRRKLPPSLNLVSLPREGSMAHVHDFCAGWSQYLLNSRLGRTENTHFLEQFRYTIVASQLLNHHFNPTSYKRQKLLSPTNALLHETTQDGNVTFSWSGVSITIGVAFALVWTIHWARYMTKSRSSRWRLGLVMLIFIIVGTSLYAYLRRQWLHYLRIQAVESASSLVTNAQSFDAAVSATITLIQEVELVSRGYKLSNPLPPITRLEDHSQTRRCTRLRRTLHSSLASMVLPHAEAYDGLKLLAVKADLEKYFDIYEISRTDTGEASDLMTIQDTDMVNSEDLKGLKISFQKLHMIRKSCFCSLLALDADGGESDFPRWSAAIQTMKQLSLRFAESTISLDVILDEEERESKSSPKGSEGLIERFQGFTLPPTPKAPLSPGRERMRIQMRKLGSLSQGIRGLQAKMHLLREESDNALEETDKISEFGGNLMLQYDSIGADLKDLMREWEDGKSALAVNIDKNERRVSLSSAGNASPRSPTQSLGGLTVVGGSPSDAMKVPHGDARSNRSRSSTGTSSSGEEIFEAVAAARPKSTLSREERIAKIKEDRVKQMVSKGKAEENTHMLRELETVIKLRPRGRTTGQMSYV